MSPKVGIYSGSFDPVHEGHIAFAKQAIKSANLDKVFFLVEPRPRRKQGVKALEHRVRMVELATTNEPKLGVISLNQARFTVQDTLPVLMSRFEGAELHLLMGSDVLMHLAEWPHIEELTKKVQLIIGIRAKDHVRTKDHIMMIEKAKGLKLRYYLFESEELTTSSTHIRQDLKHGRTPQGLPAVVRKYITDNALYTSLSDS